MVCKHGGQERYKNTSTQQRFSKSGGSVLVVRQLAEVNQTLVLRINPDSCRDGKNRHLRQAAKRYASL